MKVVARERFELSSAGPKPAMLDHYTTGLHQSLSHKRGNFIKTLPSHHDKLDASENHIVQKEALRKEQICEKRPGEVFVSEVEISPVPLFQFMLCHN